jgi:hypothetical protein
MPYEDFRPAATNSWRYLNVTYGASWKISINITYSNVAMYSNNFDTCSTFCIILNFFFKYIHSISHFSQLTYKFCAYLGKRKFTVIRIWQFSMKKIRGYFYCNMLFSCNRTRWYRVKWCILITVYHYILTKILRKCIFLWNYIYINGTWRD